jgi:hypothetical protein
MLERAVWMGSPSSWYVDRVFHIDWHRSTQVRCGSRCLTCWRFSLSDSKFQCHIRFCHADIQEPSLLWDEVLGKVFELRRLRTRGRARAFFAHYMLGGERGGLAPAARCPSAVSADHLIPTAWNCVK